MSADFFRRTNRKIAGTFLTFAKRLFVFTGTAAFTVALTCVPAAAKTFNVFILTGQSNSLGAIKGNDAYEERMVPAPKKVRFWHGNFGSYCTGTSSVEWGRVEPQRESQTVMGPEYGFAQAFEADVADEVGFAPEDCGILKVARDGGGNSLWLAPDGDAFRQILVVAGRAFAALPKLGYDRVEVRALLYLQGESDSPEEIPFAGTRVAALRENLIRALAAKKIEGIETISSRRMILLVGEPANFFGREARAADGTTSQERLKKTAQNALRAAWIPTRDLPKITHGDALGVHYNGNAQITIGRRFAEAFAKAYEELLADEAADSARAAAAAAEEENSAGTENSGTEATENFGGADSENSFEETRKTRSAGTAKFSSAAVR